MCNILILFTIIPNKLRYYTTWGTLFRYVIFFVLYLRSETGFKANFTDNSKVHFYIKRETGMSTGNHLMRDD